MDIVYLVKNDEENDSEELRYSLRSLQNIPHDKVVIVGEKPDWATNVTYIPVEQNKTKPENVAMNLSAAITSELVSDDFLLMNDDFFIMKSIPEMPSLNFGKITDVVADYLARYPEGSEYIDGMKTLHDILVDKGFSEPMSYELHSPLVLNKQNVASLHEKIEGRLYQFRSAYGNYFPNNSVTVPDVKIFLDATHNAPEYNENPSAYLERQTFLSATGGAFKRGPAGDFVRSSFPDKSPYEL